MFQFLFNPHDIQGSEATSPSDTVSTITTTSSEKLNVSSDGKSTETSATVTTGIIVAVVIVLLAVVAAAPLIICAVRKHTRKQEMNNSTFYSVLRRKTFVQQSCSSDGLYNQITPCPLTGQAEFVLNDDYENINNSKVQHERESISTHPTLEREQCKEQTVAASLNQQSKNNEQPTYAVVNKSGPKVRNKECVLRQNTSNKCPPKHVTKHCQHETVYQSDVAKSLDELYAVVKKKPKGGAAKEDENAPPIPPHTVEELYTAVNKIPKVRAATKEEKAPPIPPHTVEELYTAVNKTPKGNAADDEEEASPIPPQSL